MSNRGLIIRLILGIVLLAGALWGLNRRSQAVASVHSRTSLSTLDPASIASIRIETGSYTANVEKVAAPESWKIKSSGGESSADPAVVMKLVDQLSRAAIGDTLAFRELRDLHLAPSDFGLAPPRASITLATEQMAKSVKIELGANTPTRNEVYAMADGLMNVFTVPVAVLETLPETLDGFRPRRLLPFESPAISAIDLRVPNAPFVKLVRTSGSWRLKSSESAPALPATVDALIDAMATSPVLAYVSVGTALPASQLAPYGIDVEKGLSVTVYGPGDPVQIVFGSAVEDAVYALVQNGTAVVKVPASLAAACTVNFDSLRDTRLFPVAASQVDSVTVSTSDGVLILRRGEEGWSLESPVACAADQESVSAFLQKLLAFDSSVTSSVPLEAVTVKIGGISAPMPLGFPDDALLASLHTRLVLSLEPSILSKVSISGDGVETVTWPKVANEPIPGAITEALANLTALEMVNLAASPAELARYGLDRPYRTIAIDLKATDSIRKNLIIGASRQDGSRYAMLSGAATVFVLSVASLAAFGV